jgi:aminopeptidase N
MRAPISATFLPQRLASRLLASGFFSLLVSLSACHNPRLSARHEALDSIGVSAHNNPREIFRTSAPRIWEIINTSVTLRFDFEQKEAEGEALLSIMPYTHAADTLVLDAKSMDIHSVAEKNMTSGALHPLGYSYDGLQLKIDVRSLRFGSLASNMARTIRIEYTAKPYAAPVGGSAAISEDRGLYFINTDHAIPGKPVQIWTQGETESNSHWVPTIDKPNQRSTFSISLVVPDSMTTLSNGRLSARQPLGNAMRMDTWLMPRPIQVYAAMFAIGRYDVVRDSWQDDRGQSFEVSYYVEPEYAPFARGMFRYTPEMMTCFSKATGVQYPWVKYSQVVARDYVSGAMENTTASLFGEFTNKNGRQLLDENNEDVVSHELFHQWFGDYVTCESWSHITLNESFATYGEQLWCAWKHGKASADEHAWNGLQAYLAATKLSDPPLVRFHYTSREDVFDRISYQKGGAILRYISSITGDTLFSRAMEFYLRRHALESAEADDWRLALERTTGYDWRPFFKEWYYRGGHPELRVRYAYDDAGRKMSVLLRQRNAPDSAYLYDLRLKAAVMYEGQPTRIDEWRINRREQRFSYPADAQGRYPLVIVDAEHVLPGRIDEEKPMEMWLRQLRGSSDYTSKILAVDAAVRNDAQSLSPAVLADALRDSMAGVRLYVLRRVAGLKRQSARDVLLPQIKFAVQTAGNNQERAAAFAVLGSWNIKGAIDDMIPAVSDSSYLVAGAALAALNTLAPDTAYRLARALLPQQPRSLLEASVWAAVASQGKPGDLALLAENAQRVYGREKIALAENVALYARSVKDDSLFARSLALIESMTQSESIRTYRYAMGASVFGLLKDYREDKNSSRLQLVQQSVARIEKAEPDQENKDKYRKLSAGH